MRDLDLDRRAARLFAQMLLVAAGLAGLQSCGAAAAVSVAPGRIGQVRLGFGLGLDGSVSAGCSSATFSQNDPIHLSLQVTDAASGSMVRVSVQDVVTHRIAWSEDRPVSPGWSSQTFAIGRGLAQGRFRVASTLDDQAATSREFVVHARREGVR